MSKRFFTMLLASFMTLMCGCQLAQPDGDVAATARGDQLVGVFITTQYLDLMDWDAWLEDNAGKIADGELVLPEGSGATQRFYATLTENTITDRDGEAHTVTQYVFEGLEGIILASYRMGDFSDPDSLYHSTDCGEGVQDVSTRLMAMDDGTLREVLGTIYLLSDSGESIFYFNPVYQTADGAVYLVPGNGLHTGSEMGCTATHTVTGTMTETENGTETTHTVKIEMKLDFVAVAEKIVLIQMDENNREIARDEFIPGQMPAEFTPGNNAAYLIVEEHTAEGVLRTIHQRGCDPIGVFRTVDGKICVREYTAVKW